MDSKIEIIDKVMWKVNTFRFTIFPNPDYNIDDKWWEILIGTPPDVTSQQPKYQIRHYEGTYESGKFIIDINPAIIHLIYTPNQDPQAITQSFINLGNCDDVSKIFIHLVEKWLSLSNCPSANRIALGGVLLTPVESKIEAYQKLEKFLPSVKIDTEHSTDFMFQINRPRKSLKYTGDLYLNRLSKWSVLQTSISPLFSISPQQKTILGEFFIKLEYDINTQADFKEEFTPNQQKNIFAELISLGNEIELKGDI